MEKETLSGDTLGGDMGSAAIPFGDWLRSEMERLDVPAAEVSRRTGFDSGVISNWLSGKRRPNAESCTRLAMALGIDPDVLLARAGHRPLREPISRYELERQLGTLAREIGGLREVVRNAGNVRVPFLGRVPADSVRWSAVEGEQLGKDVPEFMLRGRSPRDVFIVEASGDCLRSRGIVSGDWVFCERAASKAPDNGSIVVVRFGDEYSLKVWNREGDWIELRDGDNEPVRRMSILSDFTLVGIVFARFG